MDIWFWLGFGMYTFLVAFIGWMLCLVGYVLKQDRLAVLERLQVYVPQRVDLPHPFAIARDALYWQQKRQQEQEYGRPIQEEL
jgi:hypothetical protein